MRERRTFMLARGRPAIIAPGLILILSLAACGGAQPTGETVAAVDGTEFSVEEAAEILAPFDRFDNGRESVRSLADLWIDYRVLAEAMATDSTLQDVDLTAVRDFQVRQRKVLDLRDTLVQVDTSFTDEELRQSYAEEDFGTEIHARHILIVPPVGATPSQLDSLRDFTEALRARIESGEQSFEAAAAAFSDDATAEDGGDLGFFGRGTMVPAFEDAAFALQPGELSHAIQTQFGFHIIRVDERRKVPFEDVRDRYRTLLQQKVQAEAEGEYILQVDDSAGVSITESGPATLDALIENPWRPLSSSEAREPLVEWNGGAVTAGDVRDFLVSQPREVSVQVRTSDADAREALLKNFARQAILLEEADSMGLGGLEAEWRITEPILRSQATTNAETLGLFPIEPAADEDREAAVTRAVHDALVGNLSGDLTLVALGAAIGPIRAEHRIRLYPEAFSAVVTRVNEIRSQEGFEPFRRAQPDTSDRNPAAPAAGGADDGSDSAPSADN
jgi:PPIC-type PPIASE domain